MVPSLKYAPKGAPPVPPPTLTSACDALARPPLDARDVRVAGPAHVCRKEDGQTLNMSYRELYGSHSSQCSQGALASGRRAQSRGTHEAGILSSRPRSQQRTC